MALKLNLELMGCDCTDCKWHHVFQSELAYWEVDGSLCTRPSPRRAGGVERVDTLSKYLPLEVLTEISYH